MSERYDYSRVLLKISGETLKGGLDHGYDASAVEMVVEKVGAIVDSGVEMALVVGAGNVWRGMMGTQRGMDRVTADYMGMLGTAMNALCLRDAFSSAGFSVELQSAISMGPMLPRYDRNKTLEALDSGKIVIFAGGTGSPFFTTDTTAALRALEIGAQAVLKATKVDGVYSDDPVANPAAKRFDRLSFDEALAKKLKIMDSTAFSMCRDNDLPILVFDFFAPDSLERALSGDASVATIVS